MLTTEITEGNIELVTIRGGSAVTTTLTISVGTKVSHEAVIKLVRTYQTDIEEFGPIGFEIQKGSALPQGGFARATEYAILNEEQSALLLSYMRNNDIVRHFKKSLIREFYAMRSKLSAAPVPAELSRMQLIEIAMQAETERLTLAEKIAADAPKVAFAEIIRNTDAVCRIGDFCKTMKAGRNKLFARMKADKILMENRMPYQKYIDKGYFSVIEQKPYKDSKGVSHPAFTTMVTGAGQLFLTRKYHDLTGAV